MTFSSRGQRGRKYEIFKCCVTLLTLPHFPIGIQLIVTNDDCYWEVFEEI